MNNTLHTALRRCLRDPIPEIEQAAVLLEAAVAAHLEGRRADAIDLICAANLEVIRDWTESLWGRKSPYAPSGPYSGPPFIQAPAIARMPGLRLQRLVLARDGFYCRFCGIPVIRKQVREHLRATYPALWGRRNQDQHAALQCMWAQYDHLLPHSRSGDNALSNLVLTCAPCNYARMQ